MERIILVKSGERVTDTTQTSGMIRQEGVGAETCGNNGLWVGFVSSPPGPSGAHYHADAESAIYVIKGRIRMHFGENLELSVDATDGDFLYVPPNTVHIEENLSKDEMVELIVARNTTSSLVVNVPGTGISA
jgi:uncharacterized RmlC-like cupin family protein